MTGAGRRVLADRRRTAAERLRREAARIDGSGQHPYFRVLRRELRTFRRAVPLSQVLGAAAAADLVWVGDFHAVPRCQTFAADLLEHCARAARGFSLGVEFVHTRQQRWLDALQDGRLDGEAFRRRVHYREEWGYPWSGFGSLLERARGVSAPVFALDCPPRRGYGGLARRDRHAARRIASVLAAEPSRRMVVLFGESHLADAHLPGKVREGFRRRGMALRDVVIFQNPDELYWEAVREDDSPPEAVEVRDGVYAVFHTSPLAKYEAYRQVLEAWRSDDANDGDLDLTPAVHHLIDVLLEWLGVPSRGRRVRHRDSWEQDLADAYPEVYSGEEARDLLPSILAENDRSASEIAEAIERFERRGALYDARANAMFLTTFLPARAAGESAKFVRAALTGRLFARESAATSVDPAARAYGTAYNEALSYLAARLVDPASDYLEDEERRALGPGRDGDAAARGAWLSAHVEFESGGEGPIPPAILGPLRGPRPESRDLARDLGNRLGRRLYERVRAGRMTRSALRGLFTRALRPEQAPATVLRLLRGH